MGVTLQKKTTKLEPERLIQGLVKGGIAVFLCSLFVCLFGSVCVRLWLRSISVCL